MSPRTARQPSAVGVTVRKHRPDYGLVLISSVLLVIGLVVMFSISPALAALGGNVSDNYFVTRQFVAILLGIVAFFLVSKIPLSTWEKWQKPLLVAAFVLSLATLAFGSHLANRWIQLGAFSFQPVEFVKFTLVILGSVFLAKAANEGKAGSMHNLKPMILVFAAFSFVVVVLQRDLGSTFVLVSMGIAMAFVAGVPMKRLAIFSLVAFMLGIAAISTTAYRRERLLTFFQPERDCSNTGYHACQAMIAVGSGGVLGVGIGRGVQAYGYLPEAANDSIFAIYAEKFGFVGVMILLGLFGSLLLRIFNVMQRAPNRATQLMAVAVFTWFSVQAVVNIGAMVGILPLKGITLPFISYGGTSLIFSMAALGIVFNISGYTVMRKRAAAGFENERVQDEGSAHWRRDSRPRYSIARRSF